MSKPKTVWMIYQCYKDMDMEDVREGNGYYGNIPAPNIGAPEEFFATTMDKKLRKGKWIDKTITDTSGKKWPSWWYVPEHGEFYYQFQHLKVDR